MAPPVSLPSGSSTRADLRGRGLSLWWLPQADLAARMDGLIHTLAERLGTPAFPAHVTVESGLLGYPEELVRTLSEAREAHVAPLLSMREIATQPAWNRALTVELALTEEIARARMEVCLALGRTVAPTGYQPHLSLVYGHLDEGLRQRMAASLRLSMTPFRPAHLALVDTRGTVSEWWEVERWPVAAPGA